MRIIKPFGNRIIISPIGSEYKRTEGGIDVDNDLLEGVVIAVSEDMKELFSIDDVVLYPKDGGHSQYYKGKACVWLNADKNGLNEIWGIVTEDERIENVNSKIS